MIDPKALLNVSRRVLISSPFIPPEFIAAYGFMPSRVAAQASTDCHQGRCAVAAGIVQGVARTESTDLAVIATSCDQQRRSGDDAHIPVFHFNLPATWNSVTAARIFRDEIERLGRFLVRHGGVAPDLASLASHALDHDERRRRLRAGCALLPSRAAAEVLADYAEHGRIPAADPVPLARDDSVPVALLGGPLPRASFGLHDLIISAGARVALDGTEHGERGLPAPFDRRRVAEDPLGELVNAYFLSIPDAFRRPDRLLYDWLEQGVAERGLRAVVVRCDPWCDLWRAQVPRLKDWNRLPVLLIEAGEDRASLPRLRTRIEALVEMLR